MRIQAFRVVGAVTALCMTLYSLMAAAPVVLAKVPPPTSPNVFILVPGIDTALTKDDIKNGVTPGFDSIKTAITQAVPDAQFVTYSYAGPASKKNPKPTQYTCAQTIENPISVDIKVLDKQIQAVLFNDPGANIYLVGHSLGGVVAYGYMAALAEGVAVDPLPDGNLQGVVTLDSPIGGVSSDSAYLSNSIAFFEASCPDFASELPTAPLQLGTIFDSFTSGQPRGGKASVLAVPFPKKDHVPKPAPSNQVTAQDAQAMGISTLTVGNWNDLLWDPQVCGISVDQFEATQWIMDRGDNSGMYGRTITSGNTGDCFFDGVVGQANHLNVLSDANVMQAIQQFVTGQTPSALPPAAGES